MTILQNNLSVMDRSVPSTSQKREALHPAAPKCRFCAAPLKDTFVNLGMSPLCESYLTRDQLNRMEAFYPLHTRVCGECFLVQLDEYVSAEEIFTEYAYFSSYSESWLKNASDYVDMIVKRLKLGKTSKVVELASNDGYLLQNFVKKGIPALGVEPAANVAKAAEEKGVRTLVKFFGRKTAQEMAADGKADLIIGNNVLAQVPDLNDFVGGIGMLLAPDGTLTLEFPHLQRLIEGNQFDTIYHEHFSYFSLLTAERILRHHRLRIYDVEELETHGGSLRIYATHIEGSAPEEERVGALRSREVALGYNQRAIYRTFDERVQETKRNLLKFLIEARREGKSIAGYGAPGKGNTLLNYCGIREDFLGYTVDRNPYKHGRFLPGTHIPIYKPERLQETRPDYILILPWNLKREIAAQLEYTREWGAKLVVAVPALEVF